MTCPSLEQLANGAIAAIAGQIPAREYARLAGTDALAQIRYRYGHVDSALFARTVAAITGWPVVQITSPGGEVHHLVAVLGKEGGRLVDVTGIVSETDLQQRYGATHLAPLAALPLDPDEDATRLAVLQLLAQWDCPPFNGLDFQRQLYIFCVAQQIPDEQLPPRLTCDQIEAAAAANDTRLAHQFLGRALAERSLHDEQWQYYGAIAARNNNVEFVRALLDAKDIHILLADEEDKETWLHAAASAGAMDTVKLLLEHPRSAHLAGMVCAVCETADWSPLHYAACRADTVMAAALIAAGAKVDAAHSGSGMTPLHSCLHERHEQELQAAQIETVKLLLAHGADPLLFSAEGGSALHYAAGAGLVDVVQLLFERGVPVDHVGPENSVPPIFAAATTDFVDALDALRALGANSAAHSKAGDTLLTHCIRFGLDHARPKMVQHLLEVVGMDPDQPNLHGETPDAMARYLPEVSQVLGAFRAKRAMALALAGARGRHTAPARGSSYAKP